MPYEPVTAPEITAWMAAHPPADRLARADAIVDRLDALVASDPSRFGVEPCDALLRALEGVPRAATRRWLESRTTSPVSLYLHARVRAAERDNAGAAPVWAQLVAALPRRDPEVLLQYARVLEALEDHPGAAACLRDALACRPSYAFHARAAAAIDRILRRTSDAVRQARIAMLGSSTTQLLAPVLRALCFRDRIEADIYEAPYGAFRQEILDPSSGLYRFEPTVVFIVTHWRDLQLPPVATDEPALIESTVGEYRQLWDTLASRTQAHIVQHGFDLPGAESHDDVATRPGGRTRVIHSINVALAAAAAGPVTLLDTTSVQLEIGRDSWEDGALWATARQHPSTAALPALAEAQVACVRAVAGLTRKVIACDLDNTLWGGIIGEDGLDGIRVGPGSPAGEAFAALQDYLLELQRRGVLLAVCSKNNPDDARLPFEQHPQMRLRLEHFAAFVANWEDKVTSLRSIANTLSLGLDSFVFLDDNPFERAWVRSQLPDVAVVELGRSPFTFVRELDRLRLFRTVAMTEEDHRRTDLYRQAAAADAARKAAGSLDEFLEQLGMIARDVPIDPSNLARVTQLINKTNQFNLTTRRRSEAAVAEFASNASGWARAFHLSDRFGDHGLIGVLICTAPTPGTWEIDTWLMSCRVLGRRMEQFMFDRMLEAARTAGIDRIAGVYRPTPKNGQVAGLYAQLGFEPVGAGEDESRYEYAIARTEGRQSGPAFITRVEEEVGS